MFCKNCERAFGGEIDTCPDCGGPLYEKPPVGDIQPFVRVFETSDRVLLSSATSLLDGAKIPFAVQSLDGTESGPTQVLVPEEYARDVQELLLRQAGEIEDS